MVFIRESCLAFQEGLLVNPKVRMRHEKYYNFFSIPANQYSQNSSQIVFWIIIGPMGYLTGALWMLVGTTKGMYSKKTPLPLRNEPGRDFLPRLDSRTAINNVFHLIKMDIFKPLQNISYETSIDSEFSLISKMYYLKHLFW